MKADLRLKPFPMFLLTLIGTTLFVLTGCGGEGGGGESAAPSSPASSPASGPAVAGMVQLPAGTAIDASTLNVATGAGTAKVGANGAFSAPFSGEGQSLVAVLDPAGKLVLLGYVDPAGQAAIGPKESAVALLFQALGAFTLPAEEQETLRMLLAGSAQTGELAAVIASRVAENPTALADGDQQVLEALTQSLASLLEDPPQVPSAQTARLRSAAVARSTVAPAVMSAANIPGTTLTLVNPTDPQEGLQLGPNPSGEGLILMNTYRRASYYYAYKIATEDEEGNRYDLQPPFPAIDATAMQATNQLNGVFGTVLDILNHKVFWTPVQSDPFELPLEAGAAKTFYQVVAVGPSFDLTSPTFFSESRFVGFVPQWEESILSLTSTAFVKDMLLPVAFSWVLESDKINAALKVENPEFISKTISAMVFKALPEAKDQVLAGEWKEAMLTIVKELAGSDEFRQAFITALQDYFQNAAVLDVLSDPDALISSLTHANMVIEAIDKAMTAGDIGAVIKDIGSSRRGNLWEVTVVKPMIRLDPEQAEAEPLDRIALTAKSPTGVQGVFVYQWSVSGGNGHLEDANGHSGSAFESSSPNVSYVADPEVTDGATDAVTVRVYLKPDAGSGTTHGDPIFLGEADSEISLTVPPMCTDLDYAILASGCGSVSLSSMDLTAGDKLVVSVHIGCEGVELSADYALTSGVVVDGVPVTARSGSAALYSYSGWPYKPSARGGAVVSLTPGPHTVEFTIRYDAPNDCVFWDSALSWYARGPWVILGNGRWSTAVPFRVHQKGI